MKILKIFLRISAVATALGWGFSHLFFPEWYYGIIGVAGIDFAQGFVAIAMDIIGVLTLGIAAATWLAAADPARNKAILQMLYAAGLGAMAVFSYHILFRDFSSGEWINVVFIAVQLIILTVLYPKGDPGRSGYLKQKIKKLMRPI